MVFAVAGSATLGDVANVTAKQESTVTAQTRYAEGLLLFRELGNQRGITYPG